jgi:hypothetical protein
MPTMIVKTVFGWARVALVRYGAQNGKTLELNKDVGMARG